MRTPARSLKGGAQGAAGRAPRGREHSDRGRRGLSRPPPRPRSRVPGGRLVPSGREPGRGVGARRPGLAPPP
eukprot:1526603-Prymnesium_polylepis.1